VQAVAGLCLLLFVVITTVVGVRMLLLARRTRGRHELLMGAGMVLIGGIGFPGSIVSGFGGPVSQLSMPLWAVSSMFTQVGIALIYAFTWQVFRPGDAWGKYAVAGGVFFMASGTIAAGIALAGAPPEASSQAVARNGIFVSMIGFCGCFLWSAIEGFVHYGNARKRLALGLADAVVVDRFRLWAVFGLSATGVNAASAIGNAIGVNPSQSPLVLVPMGVLGFVASVAIYLAFLPPESYLQRVRARFAA
jgi:hypothetical protein